MEPRKMPDPIPEPIDGLWDLERPIPGDIYPVIDNDLARDNLENDIPNADLTDL